MTSVFALVRAIKPAERKAVLKIRSKYFIKTPDGYIQERADEEIVDFKGKSEKASRSAKKRWDANAHANASETHMRTHMQLKASERNANSDASHSQIPKSEQETSKQPPKPPARKLADVLPNEFGNWYHSYPRKVGRKDALRAWRKIKPTSEPAASMTRAIRNQVAQHHFQNGQGEDFVPNPATWLNQGRWDDEIAESPQARKDRELEQKMKQVRMEIDKEAK